MKLGQITFLPILAPWVVVLLFLLGVGAVVVQHGLIRKKLGDARALGLSLLRLAALILIISFALNPSLVKREERRVPPAVAVIVDASRSMGLAGTSGKGTRLDEAKALLLDPHSSFLKSLGQKAEVKLYGLGESLNPLEAGELKGLKAAEKKGDLAEALRSLGGKASVVVLLSDGGLEWEGSGGPAGLPVMTVPVGDPAMYKDILIKSIKAPAVVFRGREAAIDVTVRGYGSAGLTIPALLKEGNKVLTARSVHFDNNPSEKTVSFPFTLEEIGQHHLSVSVPPQVGESMSANNTADLSVKVVRDKIRILMVSGSPSLNYRFMRAALKNDPSIDLLSFVILRTPSDIINVPLQEQSLIPFPVETLFTKELKSFDLLIFDNLRSHLYLIPGYYDAIREFVRSGGGFAMIGGPSLLDEGKYVGTPVADILPVRVTGKDDYRRKPPEGVKLTRAGISHPLTRFSASEKDSPWREMPDLNGINLLTPKASGTVLLEGTGGDSEPILTIGSFGKGRVLVLATDDSWKWDMGPVAKGRGNWTYLRFIEKTVRWLTKDPNMDPVQMTLPERIGGIGEEIGVRIKVSDEDASQTARGGVSLSVFNPDGVKTASQLKRMDQPGEYLGSFVPDKEGSFRVRVETQTGALEESILVTGSQAGLDANPDHEKLRKVSASMGGKFLSGKDDLLKEIGAYTDKVNNRFVEERRVSVWENVSVLILVVACLAVEWFYRRRWGLV